MKNSNLGLILFVALTVTGNAQGPTEGVRLRGHVLGMLSSAAHLPRDPQAAGEQMTFTVVLNRSDPAGFEAFRRDFHDPASPTYRQTIGADELTARFGPSQAAYDKVLTWLQQSGFALVAGSDNRLTITVRGTRAQAERAFGISMDDYQLGDRQFHANDTDPAFPAPLAPLIHGVSGLANLARPLPATAPSPANATTYQFLYNGAWNQTGGLPPIINGSGQAVGVIAYDNFLQTNLINSLNNSGLTASMASQVSTVNINGGTASTQGGELEVLLDIVSVLGMAPGARVVVFDAPPSTDFTAMLNAAAGSLNLMNGGRGGILSQSFVQCEAQVSPSEMSNMEHLLEGFPLSGLSFFVGSGDAGSTCVPAQGPTYPNNVYFPASAPSAVAVGGTSLLVDANNNYLSETWWNDARGSGGFGISATYLAPVWQSGFNSSAYRSIPDVAADAGDGTTLCQQPIPDPTGLPSCRSIGGGTSMATPLWAGAWALVTQAYAQSHPGARFPSANGGFLYELLNYPNGAFNVFHPSTAVAGPFFDFTHVGLGSPNITNLAAKVAGPPSVSSVSVHSGGDAGGTSVIINGSAFVGVQSVNFGTVPGKFTVLSESQLVAVSPVAPTNGLGYVDITVTTPAGTSAGSSADSFYYCPPILSVSPSAGSINGGDVVTVTGTGFNTQNYPNTTPFLFGGYSATNVYCYSAQQCQMTSPAHGAGTVNVTVGLPGSLEVPAVDYQFTYTLPQVTSISPSVGSAYGGTIVDIHGVGLDKTMTLKFGGNIATFYCRSSYWCTATAPASTGDALGSVYVTFTTGTYTSPSGPTFTYQAFPVIYISTPLSGSANTAVTVLGLNFSTVPGVTTFMFGQSPATDVYCKSTGFCTMTAPPESPLDSANGNEVELSVTNTFTVVLKGSTYKVVQTTYGGLLGPAYASTYGGWFTYPPPVPPPPICKGTTCQ